MEKKAVIDRFEGNLAVIVLETNDKQMIYLKNNLPIGVKEGDWLLIEIQGDEIIKINIDIQAKENAKRRITRKMEKLRNEKNQ
jgi:hypothetical protein